MADGSTFPTLVAGSPKLEHAARLAELESDIRRVARESYRPEPTLEEAAALARWIAANSWDADGLLNGCMFGPRCTNPSLSLLHNYTAGRDELATAGNLAARLHADMDRLDQASEAEDVAADAADRQGAAQACPREAAWHGSVAIACRARAAAIHLQARVVETHWHEARRASEAATMKVAA